MEFVQAIPLALAQRSDLTFLIIGTGRLDKYLEKTLEGQSWASHVTWLKWVEHERIPDYLNQLRLVVIPSYSEGVPSLALEAMGCGTPILATPAGGIPDLVTDGETGFLLADNTPPVIAQAVVRVVDDPRLESIAQRARALIECEFSLDAASRRYRVMIGKLDGTED
jgi:glycosyltransferase involved in cell wall biosynthesis